MPGGRPPKPGTSEEKALARRERVRQHVRAYRQRKRQQQGARVMVCARAQPQLPTAPLQPDDAAGLPIRTPSYDLTDVAGLSQKPHIDLSFGFLPAVVHDFDAVTGARFPWSLAVQQAQPANRVVDLAVLAAGTRTLARIQGNNSMAEFARVAYQHALRCLRPWLEQRGQGYDMLLAAVPLALMAFESGDGSSRALGSPWAAHASGCANLMLSAGPEAFQSPLGVMFLRALRWVPHSLSLMHRKPYFLEEEAWQNIPFKHIPKNKEDLLWEALVRSPRLLYYADVLDTELKQGQNTCHQTAISLYSGILEAQIALRSWMEDLHKSSPNGSAYHEEPVAGWFRRSLPNIFETSFHYHSLFEADWTLMHWTSLLNLHVSAKTAAQNLRLAGYVELAEKFDQIAGPRTVHERIAYNICQSIEFCIGPDPKVIAGTALACHRPLQRAFTYFLSDETRYVEEIRWCGAVEDLVVKRGPHVKGYLKDKIG